jgi:hypothetical protein
MTEIMLDIETYSTNPNAVILTIGAIKFNRSDDLIPLDKMEKFYRRITLDSCISLGMHIDPNTARWWSNQSKVSLYEALKNKDRVPIQQALHEFSKFCTGKELIWANSPCFDCVILNQAYEACKLEIPWKFWNTRDCRTLYDLGKVNLKDIIGNLSPHHAIYDCYNQIKGLKKALVNLNK